MSSSSTSDHPESTTVESEGRELGDYTRKLLSNLGQLPGNSGLTPVLSTFGDVLMDPNQEDQGQHTPVGNAGGRGKRKSTDETTSGKRARMSDAFNSAPRSTLTDEDEDMDAQFLGEDIFKALQRSPSGNYKLGSGHDSLGSTESLVNDYKAVRFNKSSYNLLTNEEKKRVAQEMSNRGLRPSEWTAWEFANIYLPFGTNTALLSFCRTVKDQMSALEEAELLKEPIQSTQFQGNHRSTAAEMEARRKQLRLAKDKENQAIHAKYRAWDAAFEFVGSDQPHEISEVFPQIDQKEGARLIRGIPTYTPTATSDLSDFLFWAKYVRSRIPPNSTEKSNYVLLTLAGSAYSAEVLKNFKLMTPRIPTKWVIRHMARKSYFYRGINTLTLAKEAVIGQFSCSTPLEFYHRIIELHYCRTPKVDAIQFVRDVFLAVYFQIAKYDRAALVANIEKYYPGFSTQLTGDVPSTSIEDIDEDPVDMELILPLTEPQIAEFCTRLIKAACLPTLSLIESQNTEHCGHPQDYRLGLLKPPRKEGFKDKPQKLVQVVSEVRRFSSEKPEDQSHQGDKGPKPSPRVKKNCLHCHQTTHNKDECWKLFPELKVKYLKEKNLNKKPGNNSRRGTSAPPYQKQKGNNPPSTNGRSNPKTEFVSQVQQSIKTEEAASSLGHLVDQDFP